MKTRIIQTRFWEDAKVCSLTSEARLVFIYLLTCSRINLSGVFEMSLRQISFDTGVKEKDLPEICHELESQKRVLFRDGWIKVVNAIKYNNYMNSPMNKIAYEKELTLVPANILESFDTSIHTTIDTIPIVTINNKPEIRSKKSEVKSTSEGKEVLEKWNEVFGTKYKSTKDFEANMALRMETYSIEEIKKAIENAHTDDWWKAHGDPVIFFRQTNQQKQPVDYVGKLLNIKSSVEKEQYYA